MTRYSSEMQELLHLIKAEIINSKRPPEEIVLDDVDLQNILKCSKRKTAELREKRMITYMKPGKVYYRLSDVLKYLERYKVEAIQERLEKYFRR